MSASRGTCVTQGIHEGLQVSESWLHRLQAASVPVGTRAGAINSMCFQPLPHGSQEKRPCVLLAPETDTEKVLCKQQVNSSHHQPASHHVAK